MKCSAREELGNISEEDDEVCKGDFSPGSLVPSWERSGRGTSTVSCGDLAEVAALLISCSLLSSVACSSLFRVAGDAATVTSLADPISALTLTLLPVAGGCVNEERGDRLGTGCGGAVFCLRLLASFLLEREFGLELDIRITSIPSLVLFAVLKFILSSPGDAVEDNKGGGCSAFFSRLPVLCLMVGCTSPSD